MLIAIASCLTVLVSIVVLTRTLVRDGSGPPLPRAGMLGGLAGFAVYYLLNLGQILAPVGWPGAEMLERAIGVVSVLAVASLFFGLHVAARAPLTPSFRAWVRHEGHEPRTDLNVLLVLMAAAAAALFVIPLEDGGNSRAFLYPLPVQLAFTVVLLGYLVWTIWMGRAINNQLALSPQLRVRYRYAAFCTVIWCTNAMIFTVYLANHWHQLGDPHLTVDAVLFVSLALLLSAGARPNRLVEAMDRFGAEYLMASMPEAMVAVDSGGYVRAVNRAAERLIGQPGTALVGQRAADILETRRWSLARMARFDRVAQRDDGVVSFKDAAGAWRHMASRITTLADERGEVVGHVEILHDVTALKSAEEQLAAYSQQLEDLVAERSQALAESEARYRGLVDNLGDCLLIVQDDRIQFWNPAAAALFAEGRPSLRDVHVGEIWDTGVAAVWSTIRAALAERPHATWRGDMQWRVAPGRESECHVTVSVAQWDGKPALLVVGTDMSEHRRLQASLDRMRRLQALGTLTGGIAHDFNNYLTGIIGRLSILEGLEHDNPRTFEQLALATRAAEKARQLVARLMRFSRREGNGREPTDVAGLVRDSEPLLRSLVREEIALQWRLPDEPLYADLNPASIQEILLNLAKNADDAMKDVAGTLEFAVRSAAVNGRDCVQIVVTDTGPGMLPDVRERIFEPFFTTKPVGEGHGLGLALAHQILQEQDGTIAVDSAPGHGATFTLTFPGCAPPADAPAQEPNLALAADGQDTCILVVDDDPDVRMTTCDMLRRLGYRVATAEHGREALELVQGGEPPALILLDVVMPEMNGIECAQALERNGPDLPIIFMTGYDPDPARMRRMGANRRTLAKPFRMHQLADAVRQELAAARAAA